LYCSSQGGVGRQREIAAVVKAGRVASSRHPGLQHVARLESNRPGNKLTCSRYVTLHYVTSLRYVNAAAAADLRSVRARFSAIGKFTFLFSICLIFLLTGAQKQLLMPVTTGVKHRKNAGVYTPPLKKPKQIRYPGSVPLIRHSTASKGTQATEILGGT